MIKKILPLVIVITILLSFVPARAETLAIPYDEVMEYGDLAFTLMEILSSGGEISLEGVESLDDLKNNPDLLNQYLHSLPGQVDIGRTSFAKGSITDRNLRMLKHIRDEAALSPDQVIGQTGNNLLYWGVKEYNTFAGYSANWVNNYVSREEAESANPDPGYESVLHNINGIDNSDKNTFFFGNYASTSDLGGGYTMSSLVYPFNGFTWIATSNNQYLLNFDLNNFQCFACPLSSIYINSNNGVYSYNISLQYFSEILRYDWNNSRHNTIFFNIPVSDSYYFNGGNAFNSYSTLSDSYSGSLNDCLNRISKKIHNVNIYVDGNLWSAAGAIEDNGTIDWGDLTFNGDYEDASYDVTLPVDYDAFFDLTSLLSSIIDIINDDTHDRTLSYVDIADNIIAVDGTQAVTRSRAISEVLADDEVIEDTGDFPAIPIPPAPIHNALKGSSILAEIIDGVQNILPSELIATFWGIVFILFIIGIIKILHK